MSEYIKISDVIKICRSLYRSYGTIFDAPAPVFENLLRTVAVELPEPPEVEELRKERDELQKELARYKWVSVKDRLPEKDGFYLAWYTFKGNGHTRDIFYYNSGHGASLSSAITHWMPLPTPPESEDDVDV